MRTDRLTSLRQRLRRGADAFDFNALIEGVSTLEEPAAPPLEEPFPEEALQRDTNIERIGEEIGEDREAPPLLVAPLPPTVTLPEEDRVRNALDALADRLMQEIGRMNTAMQTGDVEEAGFCLAHVNQILELLRSVDPRGDLARRLGVRSAPPDGCVWPPTAWSIVEFAESPLSALLPQEVGSMFVRDLLYAAWGVHVEALSA